MIAIVHYTAGWVSPGVCALGAAWCFVSMHRPRRPRP